METFLIYIGKTSLAAGAFYLAFLLLFQNRKHFVFNRIYLPSSLALSFIIPLITFTTVRYIEPPTPVAESFSFLPAAPVEMTYEAPKFALEWYHYLFGIYILGSTGFLFYLLLGHFKALHIIKKSRIQELFQNLVNITTKDVHPFSFFNKIVLSEKTLSHPNLEMIVEHEKIHVKEKHTFDILFTELLFLLQWFNPFAWLLKDAVKNNLEYKTDDQITKTTDAQTYQLAMVALADKKGVAPFLTALNGSQLKNRIIMMKKKTQNKYAWLKQLVVLPLLAVLVMGLANKEVKTEILQQNNKYNIQGSNLVNEIITDVFSNNNVIIPYRLEKNIDFSNLKIIMDGKEILKDSPELRKINFTQNSNFRSTIGKVIKVLVPDMEKFEICQMDPVQGNKSFYIRTSDYVPGTSKEFESKTAMRISLDESNINAQHFAINNELVSKNEFEEKGKEGFRLLTYLPVELAKDKYGEKIEGRVLDAKTGGTNYFIESKNIITGKELKTKPVETNPQTELNNSGSKKYTIADIEISGIKYLDEPLLVQLSGLKKGQEIEVPGDAITTATKILWNQGLFSDVKISAKQIVDNNIWLDIYLQDKPRISDVNFYGVNKSEEEDINEKGLFLKGSQLSDHQMDNARQTVENIFNEKGFSNTEVNIVQRDDQSKENSIILDIYVDKNGTVKVNENSNSSNASNKNRSLPYKYDFSKLKIVVDGKEIPTDSPELKNVKFTKENNYNGKIAIDIIEALNIDLDDVKGSSYSGNPNNPYVYIRTKNYVLGTDSEFEKKFRSGKTTMKDRLENHFNTDGNSRATIRKGFDDEKTSDSSNKKMADVLNEIRIRNLKNKDEHPLFIVDGKEVENMDNLDSKKIEQIDVIKGEKAIEKYGKKAKDGVVEITTNSGFANNNIALLPGSAKEEPVYLKVEDMPHFPGGELALRRYIANTLRYPVIAQESGIEGEVYVSFIIDKKGKIANARVVKSVEELLDQEALRVVNSLPRWKPGKQDGKVVNVSYTIPITFALQDNSEERPLIVINGQPSGYRSMEEIDPGMLSSVSVVKGTEAIVKYGSAAKDGAIEIALKGWTGKYKISSQLELRKFIAEKIKYPLEAQQAGYQGTFKVAVNFSGSGKVLAISEDTSNALLELGMVTITSYKPDNNSEAPEVNSEIMTNEIERVINELPLIDIEEFKGKKVLITVDFVLQ